MLVLTRKSEERILIGGNIEIVILEVRGNTVRIGINAPREVPVVRGEIVGRESTGGVQHRCLPLPAPFQETLTITTNDENSVNVLHKFCAQRAAWRVANTESAAPANTTPMTATPTSEAAPVCADHSG